MDPFAADNSEDDIFDVALGIAGPDQDDDIAEGEAVEGNPIDFTPSTAFERPPLPPVDEDIAVFQASFQSMSVTRGGDLVLKFLVPQANKYDAMPITDFPTMLLTMAVRRYRRRFSVDDELDAAADLTGVTGAI